MKCPVLAPTPEETSLGKLWDAVDCLKEECAWWLPDINMCAVKDFARELQHIQFRLQDIVTILKERGNL